MRSSLTFLRLILWCERARVDVCVSSAVLPSVRLSVFLSGRPAPPCAAASPPAPCATVSPSLSLSMLLYLSIT